jgi:hypothetical protein
MSLLLRLRVRRQTSSPGTRRALPFRPHCHSHCP